MIGYKIMPDTAISVTNVKKNYFLYQKPIHRIFEAFHPLGKKYSTPFVALQDISFTVKRGESLGILGRNGSGKSTLLQLITGIQQPTEGSVVVDGRISALLELGAGFNPEFTGRENVFLNTAIMGISSQDTQERFKRIIKFADIGEFIDRPVKTYSSGMYIRLAFAAAISVDPEILIIDEALSVGDIFFQQKSMNHMQKMMKNCTIVLVSHDTHSIVNLCDRAILLDKGVMKFCGDPVDAVSSYTKILHEEHFSSNKKHVEREQGVANSNIVITEMVEDPAHWSEVPSEKRSGVEEAAILYISVLCRGKPVDVVKRGDLVTIRLIVHSTTDMDEIIFGYNVKDRIGNVVFGENSLCLEKSSIKLQAGHNLVEYAFYWPEVYPYEYTITVGVGQGEIALGHLVQCWAHDIVAVTAITPGRSIHGMFNTELEWVKVIAVNTSESTKALFFSQKKK